jgi:hypothetical protein
MNALERLKAANAAREQAPGTVQVMDAAKAVETVAQALPVTVSTAQDHRAAMLARLKGGPVNPPEWQPPPVSAEGQEPAKRHRRTKAEMEAARAEEQAPVQATITPVPVTEPTPAPVIRADVATDIGQPTTVKLTTDMPIPYLLVDCIPQGLEVESLANVIAMASGMICKAQSVGDYRYIEFGKGTAMLVESVVYIIKTNPGKSYFLDSRTPEGTALLNPLCALSAIVIRGVK